MPVKIFFLWCFLGLVVPLRAGGPTVMDLGLLATAAHYARADDVGSGFCGRGLFSVLTSMGYTEGIRSANGQDWEEVLFNAGWTPRVCPSPDKAPFGSVLVYLSDMRLHNKNIVGTKGGMWGHAELVGVEEGKRVYVSDAARRNPGGTVPFNFTGRAWVPPGVELASLEGEPIRRSSFSPVRYRAQAAGLLADRLGVAQVYFSGWGG